MISEKMLRTETAVKLGYAVVEQAIVDYHKLLKAKKNGRTKINLDDNEKRPIEYFAKPLIEFFQEDEWCLLLCGVSGKIILEKLKEQGEIL